MLPLRRGFGSPVRGRLVELNTSTLPTFRGEVLGDEIAGEIGLGVAGPFTRRAAELSVGV